jgi:hypothetical protein
MTDALGTAGMEAAINSHHAASNTDCTANCILAKRWINNCRDNHVVVTRFEICRRFLPTLWTSGLQSKTCDPESEPSQIIEVALNIWR